MALPEDVRALIDRMREAEGSEPTADLVGKVAAGGPELAERLAAALSDADREDTAAICRILSIIGPAARPAIPALEAMTERRRLLLRAPEADEAAAALVHVRADDPDAVLTALRSRHERVRHAAAEVIGAGETAVPDGRAPEVVDALEQMLESREMADRCHAGRALVALGHHAEPALPRLIELATARDDDGGPLETGRLHAIDALGGLGLAGVVVAPVIAGLLTDPNELVRRRAARWLGCIGPQDESCIPPLARALDFRTPAAGVAVSGDREVSDDTPREAEVSREEARLRHQWELHSVALRALGQLGSGAARALPRILAAAGSPGAKVRYHAAQALGRVGDGSPEVQGTLLGLLRDDEAGHVRRAAAGALGCLQAESHDVVVELARALRDLQTRKSAAWALGRIGPAAIEAAPDLIEAMDGDARRRSVVCKALERMGEDAAPALLYGVHRDGRWQRIGCAETIAAMQLDTPVALRSLRELLFDRREDVRQAGEMALEALADEGEDEGEDADGAD